MLLPNSHVLLYILVIISIDINNIIVLMQFLKDCRVLKIEDILPFFSDVVTIDQFKVHITYYEHGLINISL